MTLNPLAIVSSNPPKGSEAAALLPEWELELIVPKLTAAGVRTLTEEDLRTMSNARLRAVEAFRDALPDEPADFPGFSPAKQARWTPAHRAWVDACFELSAAADGALLILTGRAGLNESERERGEYLTRWHDGGTVTDARWYACSGEVRACVDCGEEDHTGDTVWELHTCPEPVRLPLPSADTPEPSEAADGSSPAPLFWFEGTKPEHGEDFPF